MFHHFHGGAFKGGEGSLSIEQLKTVLDQFDGRILDAQEWTARRKKRTLEPHHVCLTFDDALLCQYELAMPVLRERNLTAFWFVYSTALDGSAYGFEIARHFRINAFDNFSEFFKAFKDEARGQIGDALKNFTPSSYLREAPFYSDDERTYRYLRDLVLDVTPILQRMMQRRGFVPKEHAARLWITRDHLKALAGENHIIGAHSHSHPMMIAKLPIEQQYSEYLKNITDISAVVPRPESMAHPCNSYSSDTLKILSQAAIEEGFCTNQEKPARPLETPRIDASAVVDRLKQLV
jgi:peptidoglycan/xylan/chitin deacetylase (PgdA/CDA1 family)